MKTAIITREQIIETALAETIKPVVAFLLSRFQEPRAHHRRGGERNEQRNEYGHAQETANSRNKRPDNAAHQQNRNEHRHQRSAHRKHGKSDFRDPFSAACIGGIPSSK